DITVNSSSDIIGLENSVVSNGGLVDVIGNSNYLSTAGSGDLIGLRNQFNPNLTVDRIGLINLFGGKLFCNNYGLQNNFTNNGSGLHYGMQNTMSGNGNGEHFGVRSVISGSGQGTHAGVYNDLSGTGNSTKYGSRNRITTTAGGNLYGVYSEVLRTTGNAYAGYFLGDVAIGRTTANTYTLPASRGTINQIMQTDATGNVSWVNPDSVASVVNANNGLSLLGTNVQLGGALNLNTIISHGVNDLTFNLNGSGEFIVSDQGTPHFQVAANGVSTFGDDAVWRDGNTTTATMIAQIVDDVNDGRLILYENGIASVDLDTNTQFVFNEQGLDRNFRIESDGSTNMFLIDASTNRIGIREILPTTDVHLKQSANTENGGGGMTFESSTTSNVWKIYHSGSHFSFAENNIRRAYVEAGTGNYVITSDKRLKKDIETLPSVLSDLDAIDLYKFRYLTQKANDKKIIGVMAQEVQQVFPELVSTNEEGNLGVNYDGLSVIAIKAIKEQQAEIEQLKAQLEAQQKEIELIKQLLQEQ
ncbi:MAG: tail fiber domain-containing protein, partial [Psychroserpens sp.]|nr:tail fiber domain-containing protein [Psychroserpens sp.]